MFQFVQHICLFSRRVISAAVFLTFAVLGVVSFTAQGQSLSGPVDFFFAPKQNAHQPIVDAINQARSSVKMVMFHLSDPDVGNALLAAAKRGVNVRVIFDKGQWRSPNDQTLVNSMKSAGVNVVQATSAFRITHEKAMVIDDNRAMISTMNQIKTYMKMFDMGILVSDQGVVDEWSKVFEADWQNASNNGNQTPELRNPNLLWAPVNASDRLISLIASAHDRIEVTVENLGFEGIQNALIDAAQRNVAVRVLVPKCDVVKPNFNYPYVQALIQGKVNAKMMPGPANEVTPYIHAKSIVVDQSRVYLGSENFSQSSLTLSREVGIIAENSDLANNVDSLYESLWKKAEAPPASATYKCAAFDVGTEPGSISNQSSWLDQLMIQPTIH